jgi:hypothetical protein
MVPDDAALSLTLCAMLNTVKPAIGIRRSPSFTIRANLAPEPGKPGSSGVVASWYGYALIEARAILLEMKEQP